MTEEQYATIASLLVEIRDALKAAPRARAAAAATSAPKDKEPAMTAPDEPWARFERRA